MNKTDNLDMVREYLAKIGRRGGEAKTVAKVEAARVNAVKARAARLSKRLASSIDAK